MLTSIATIAAALIASIGLGYKIYSSIKNSELKSKMKARQSLEKLILEATTDEEREALAKRLSDINSK